MEPIILLWFAFFLIMAFIMKRLWARKVSPTGVRVITQSLRYRCLEGCGHGPARLCPSTGRWEVPQTAPRL